MPAGKGTYGKTRGRPKKKKGGKKKKKFVLFSKKKKKYWQLGDLDVERQLVPRNVIYLLIKSCTQGLRLQHEENLQSIPAHMLMPIL